MPLASEKSGNVSHQTEVNDKRVKLTPLPTIDIPSSQSCHTITPENGTIVRGANIVWLRCSANRQSLVTTTGAASEIIVEDGETEQGLPKKRKETGFEMMNITLELLPNYVCHMGVHGLTTFLRENRPALSRTIHFSSQDEHFKPVVVDGWSFIYKVLEDSNLPWVYGGEYDTLSDIVVKVVKAWLAVKIRPIFVFDGSTPPEKFSTRIKRHDQSRVKPALLFFRTSSVSRNTRRFLNEARTIPPLALAVCVHALLAFQVSDAYENNTELDGDYMEAKAIDVHFADEEADPYAVELAGRVGAFVTGRDSDFVVLNSEGYLGYIPMEEMVWLAESDTSDTVAPEAEDGFQSVKGRKKSAPKRAPGLGVIPPDGGISSLSASLYTPSSLAKHLNLPVSLLPLLGALVGNDYTLQVTDRPSYASSLKPSQNLMFARSLTVSQRIMQAAMTLSTLLYGPPGKRKHKVPGSVMELIQLTVGTLLSTSGAPSALTGADQQAATVELMVEATLPYAMPPRPAEDVFLCDTVCGLHLPHECQLVARMDRTGMEGLSNYAEMVSVLYLRAYRLGKFSPSLMDILSTRTFWPETFLEHPDVETVTRSISRCTREFAYALLEHGVVIPAPLPELDDEADDEDPDELIDVVEGSDEEYGSEDDISEQVGKLRGALRDLQFDGISVDAERSMDNESWVAESNSVTSSTDPAPSFRSPEPLQRRLHVKNSISAHRKVVTEYVRRGTRIVAEEIEVLPLHHFLSSLSLTEIESSAIPIQLRPEEERLVVLVSFLGVYPQDISNLSREDRMPVLALRLVIRRLYERAEEAGNSKERLLEKWTHKDARAFLASISSSPSNLALEPPSELSERAIQLTAQISTALECIQHVVQILLLTDVIPGCAHRFSGLRFHSLLARGIDADVVEEVWHAVANGLEACFGEERQGKRKRRAQNVAEERNAPSSVSARGKITRGSSIYSLLSDISA